MSDDRYVEATAWMRNIGQEHGLIPELVIEQVAEFLAVRRAMRLAEDGQLRSEHDDDVRGGVRPRSLDPATNTFRKLKTSASSP